VEWCKRYILFDSEFDSDDDDADGREDSNPLPQREPSLQRDTSLLPQSDTSPLPQREHKSAAPKGQKSAASKRPKFVATTKDPKD
jgi:hypothetical protein